MKRELKWKKVLRPPAPKGAESVDDFIKNIDFDAPVKPVDKSDWVEMDFIDIDGMLAEGWALRDIHWRPAAEWTETLEALEDTTIMMLSGTSMNGNHRGWFLMSPEALEKFNEFEAMRQTND